MFYARAYVSPITGALSVIIMNDSRQVDAVAIDGHGSFASAHDVPMSVLSSAFVKRFANGWHYKQTTHWDYPFMGNYIGCRVERQERP